MANCFSNAIVDYGGNWHAAKTFSGKCMFKRLRGISLLLALLLAVGTLAGLAAAYRRFHVEEANRRIEIALEWQEVSLLAQTSNQPVQPLLDRFKAQHVSTLVIAEDTLTT